MVSEDCSKCCKADVCKYIEEKDKTSAKLKEIANNQNILYMSVYCVHFRENPVGIR